MYDKFLLSLSENAEFPSNVILKPKYINRIGFKITYKEGTECILWTDGEKYYALLELFSETHFIRIPQSLGDHVYDKFKTFYEGNFSYEYL